MGYSRQKNSIIVFWNSKIYKTSIKVKIIIESNRITTEDLILI